MDQSYHYPPEVLNLLVDTIPLLCRSKNDVLIFFRGAGVSESTMGDIVQRVYLDRKNINKYEIARTIIQRINEKGDSALRTRREIIKRTVEFETFSICWPEDQLKAKGLIAELRKVVKVKDSFTRMAQEREKERLEIIRNRQLKIADKEKKIERIEKIKTDFYSLFGLEDQPQKRGKLLEAILNELFRIYGLLVREDFKRVDSGGAGVMEQIDGVIELDRNIYLVEMKWVKDPIGVDKISQHLVRVYNRPDVRGLFIASNGYSDTAIAQCREALSQKVIILVTLQELVRLLEVQGDFSIMLQEKVRVATIEKNPYHEILDSPIMPIKS